MGYSPNLQSQSCTLTLGSPGVVTTAGFHTKRANDPVVFATSGSLPTGLTAGTTYYVQNPTSTTFQVAATPSGTPINFTGSQSGSQSFTPPTNTWRVIREHKEVTETYVTAVSASAAKVAAKAITDNSQWKRRHIWQLPGSQDQFEMNVSAIDDGT